MKMITALLVMVVVGLFVNAVQHGSNVSEAQGADRTVIYLGQTQGSSMVLDPTTQHMWIMDMRSTGRRTQPNWIDLGKFQGAGKPLLKE